MDSKNSIIILGGGCFWCIQAVFDMFDGVVKTTPGYAGGHTKNPTYEQVCSEESGHAEVVEVVYNRQIIGLDIILEVFFEVHDPTSLNRQGADIGTQYRSIILFNDDKDMQAILRFIEDRQRYYKAKIVTEVKKLDAFYPAEKYHMNYYNKNKSNPYCSAVIGPKIQKIKEKYNIK